MGGWEFRKIAGYTPLHILNADQRYKIVNFHDYRRNL